MRLFAVAGGFPRRPSVRRCGGDRGRQNFVDDVIPGNNVSTPEHSAWLQLLREQREGCGLSGRHCFGARNQALSFTTISPTDEQAIRAEVRPRQLGKLLLRPALLAAVLRKQSKARGRHQINADAVANRRLLRRLRETVVGDGVAVHTLCGADPSGRGRETGAARAGADTVWLGGFGRGFGTAHRGSPAPCQRRPLPRAQPALAQALPPLGRLRGRRRGGWRRGRGLRIRPLTGRRGWEPAIGDRARRRGGACRRSRLGGGEACSPASRLAPAGQQRLVEAARRRRSGVAIAAVITGSRGAGVPARLLRGERHQGAQRDARLFDIGADEPDGDQKAPSFGEIEAENQHFGAARGAVSRSRLRTRTSSQSVRTSSDGGG